MMGSFDIDGMMLTIITLDVMIVLSLVALGFAGLSFVSFFKQGAGIKQGRRRAMASIFLSVAALAWVVLAILAGVRPPPEWPVPLLLPASALASGAACMARWIRRRRIDPNSV